MISSTGIGSGLDVNSIVTQLMAIEARPLSLLQQQRSTLNAQVSAFGQFQSLAAALSDRAGALAADTLWQRTTAASSNAPAVAVTAGTGALAGRHTVRVDALASVQTLASSSFAASTSTLSEGTLTIELGTVLGEPTPTGFTPKAGASPVVITIGAGETSLAAVRDKINAAGAGVTASLVTDASGVRLSLRSSSTGAENAFRVTAAETADDGVAATGLSALGWQPTGASPMSRTQTAANAQARIDGIVVTSASNSLAGVLPGLTLDLKAVTTADAELTVEPDRAAVKAAIEGFVGAFNALTSFVREQTKFDEASQAAGTLQGDRVVLGLSSRLRGALNEASTASGTFARLADIGITMQADGTLATDATKLDAGLANLAELKKVLVADGVASGDTGFVRRFRDIADAALASDGSITTRQGGLSTLIDRNEDDQERMERRLEATEARLRVQYQALDANMASLNAISSYLTQQFASLNTNA
jgi:flagellar hook-associated protein 2